MAGKSPFAEKQVTTYKYPEPLDPAKEDEYAAQAEAEGGTYNRRIDPEELEGEHWVKFRVPRSKSDADAVADLTQSLVMVKDDGATLEQRIARGNRGVFELLCEGWSFDAEPNGANFARLDLWSGDWITACLADALAKGTTRDYAKKTKVSSNGRSSSRTKPPSTAAAE